MVSVVIIYHSGYGHTRAQAEAVKTGCEQVIGVTSYLISVADVSEKWDILNEAQAIIFGSPTYMGSVSGPFKNFMDSTSSKIWREQKWVDKFAAGFVNSGSLNGDKLMTLTQLMIFAMQHGMIWVGLGLMPGNNSSKGSSEDLNRLGSSSGAMAQSNVDQSSEIVPPVSDLKTAEYLGKRVSEATLRWHKGQI